MRLIVMLLSFALSTQVWAGEFSRPAGKVLLTMSGHIENTNEGGKAVFDLASLEKLGMVRFQTASPWYNGRTTFTGIPLQKLMDYVLSDAKTMGYEYACLLATPAGHPLYLKCGFADVFSSCVYSYATEL